MSTNILAIDCSNSDTLCLPTSQVQLNSSLPIFWARTQVPIQAPALQLRIFAGDLSINAPVDPCAINQSPVYSFDVQLTQVAEFNTFVSTTTLWIPNDAALRNVVNQRLFMQLWTPAGNCQLGPRTPGNQITSFGLLPAATGSTSNSPGVSSPENGSNPTQPVNPTQPGIPPNPESSDKPSANNTLIFGLITGAVVVVIAIALFVLFRRRSKRPPSVKSRASLDMLVDTESAFSSLHRRASVSSNGQPSFTSSNLQVQDLTMEARDVSVERKPTFLSTMSKHDAVAIGEAFKDALANPNWDRKSTES
jgi:hypothetical protein